MVRLSRAETQERNRAKVLAAARAEFTERGFRDAKIDSIAERAGFTRGAVYSNFPGKRALYFAVLADLAEHAPVPAQQPGRTAREALGAFARAWVARLPLAVDVAEPYGPDRLGIDLLSEILIEEQTRRPYAQLVKLNAILLGLALERLRPGGRQVRTAEAVLTLLYGATQLAAAAPGFVEPFDVMSACERLVESAGADAWLPPPIAPQVRPAGEPWSPPQAIDLVRASRVELAGDGVVAVLGLHRASAIEAAVRAAPAGARVTAILVTSEPAELAPLARLAIADLCGCLRQTFASSAWPQLRVVCDESGSVARAAGVPSVSDGTEVAIRVAAGRIGIRADGLGACHAVASTVDHSSG